MLARRDIAKAVELRAKHNESLRVVVGNATHLRITCHRGTPQQRQAGASPGCPDMNLCKYEITPKPTGILCYKFETDCKSSVFQYTGLSSERSWWEAKNN